MCKLEPEICYVLFEDEGLTGLFIKRTIRELRPNYKLLAESGSIYEINKILSEVNPDFIISGVKLCDGISTQIFKKISCKIPIILFTAYAQQLTSCNGLNIAFSSLKPITVANLKQSILNIESLLNTAKQADAISSSK